MAISNVSTRWRQKPPVGTILDWSSGLTEGLVGMWPLNEGTGIPANAVNCLPAASNTLTWGAGPAHGLALQNVGATSHYVQVAVPNGSPLDVTGSALSFGAWAYTTSTTNYQAVLTKSGGATFRQYSLYLTNGSQASVFCALNGTTLGGTGTTISVSPSWPLNAWFHVLLTYDGANVRVYLNGQLAGSHAYTGSIASVSGSSLYYGYDGASSNYPLSGYVDAPAVWTRCLTADEAFAIGGDPAAIWRIFRPRYEASELCVAPATSLLRVPSSSRPANTLYWS